jgi:hypothetical protein
MKTLYPDNPLRHIKSLRITLLVLCFCFFQSLSVHAEYYFLFDSETGKMEIWITGEDPHEFGVSPAGGLAINGNCTGIYADQITSLIIHGDSTNNKIDLRGMKRSDFPQLYTERHDDRKTHLFGYEGDDEIFGHDLGNYIHGGEGNDTLKGGANRDDMVGGDGKDFMYGEAGEDFMYGTDDEDYMEGGADVDNIESGLGDDIVVGDDSDIIVNLGPGNDNVVILDADGGSQKKASKNPAFKASQVEFSHLFIVDSSGIDTLDFSQYHKGITLDLDLFDSPQIYTESGDTLALSGVFESFIGTEYDDVIHIDPDPVVARYVDGGNSSGGDTLYVDAMGEVSSDDGLTITTQGYQPISHDNFEQSELINVSTVGLDPKVDSPLENRLYQNYPNPFRGSTIIRFSLKESHAIKINIYDIQGRLVKNVADREYTKGCYETSFSGEELSPGIYYFHLKGNGFLDIKKMVLLE